MEVITENAPRSIQFTTADNTKINAKLYSVDSAKAQILLGSATGVPQAFYRRFALAANARGFNVLTLDYRGIGESSPDDLNGYHVDYLDWGRLDLASGLDYLAQMSLPIYLVGHSYGGHALGLLPDNNRIAGAYFFGVGAGWSGWMPKFERLKVEFLWRCIAPVIVRKHGYLAWSKLGMGENLPKGVYQQWRRWCRYPEYFFQDPDMNWVREKFAEYKGDIVAANAIDDKWAQPASRDAFVKGYANANVESLALQPEEFGMKGIDHMGYFKQNASQIWTQVFDWIDKKQ